MVSPTFPSFSNPRSRTEFNETLEKLKKSFQDQGLPINDASRLASQIITFKSQGLTDSQISKNLEQDRVFQEEKQAERIAEQEKARASQADLIARLNKERAERARLQAERKALNERRARFAEKPKVILVANPENPRGALITREQAQIIQTRLDKAGGIKERTASSLEQKNTSILDKVRSFVANQKDASKAKVIGVNRSFVQLDNGTIVPRDQFKGEIPKQFLTNEKPVLPKSKAFDEDIFGNKIDLTDFSPTETAKNKKASSTATDPSKTTTTRKPKSVFNKDKPETTPIADSTKAITDFLSNLIPKSDTKTEVEKPTEPFDPFKSFTDFINSITKPKPTEPPIARPPTKPTPEPTPEPKPTEPEPETTNKPTAPEKTTEENKIIKFVKDNGIQIALGGISLILIAGLALSTVPSSNAISEAKK